MSNLIINKLTPTIGAEILGINFSKKLNNKLIENIYDLLIENKVLFFRNQNIKPKTQIDFAKLFGQIEPPHPVYPHVKNFPEIVCLKNDYQNPPDTDVWHTDLTFRPFPPFASILYSKIVPEYGGDTLWSSLTSIYESLSIDLKKQLSKLKAVHDMGDFRNTFVKNEKIGPANKLNKFFNKFGSSIHPIIKIHPISKKKYIYINPGFTNHIVGFNATDSNNLLTYLFSLMNKPEFQVRFKWTVNTLAIWDNRCTMHYATSDYMPNKREMHRVTILKDRREK